jgi:hypothetical protein
MLKAGSQIRLIGAVAAYVDVVSAQSSARRKALVLQDSIVVIG